MCTCRLKALFMSEPGMDDLEGANSALSTALCLWRQCPDAWLTWGQLCDRRYEADTAVGATHTARPAGHTGHIQGIYRAGGGGRGNGDRAAGKEWQTITPGQSTRLVYRIILRIAGLAGLHGQQSSLNIPGTMCLVGYASPLLCKVFAHPSLSVAVPSPCPVNSM